uniref:Uncharacterized protein n=1 Tax=Ciona intestinalis TaxID=7719 RepID=H2XRB9_CIOIN
MDGKIVFALLLLMSLQASVVFGHWNERKGAEPEFPPVLGTDSWSYKKDANDGWWKNAEDGWWKNAEDGWWKNAEDGWWKNAEDGWWKNAEDGWWKNAEDIWVWKL